MPYREKPTTRRTRVVIVVVMWLIIGIPLMIGAWTWFGWWSILLLIPAVWATADYVKVGDMFSAVDAVTRAEGQVFKGTDDEDY